MTWPRYKLDLHSVIAAYSEPGATLKSFGQRFGVSWMTIQRLIKQRGYGQMISRGPRPAGRERRERLG